MEYGVPKGSIMGPFIVLYHATFNYVNDALAFFTYFKSIMLAI